MLLELLHNPGLLVALVLLPTLLGVTRTDPGETIRQVSILEGVKRIDLPEGIYEEIELIVTSDNKAGESVDFTNLGRFRLQRDQFDGKKPAWGFDSWEWLKWFVNEWTHYTPTSDSTDGGTSTLETYLLNRIPGVLENNGLHVPSHEETTLVCDFDSKPGGSSGLNAIANSGTLEVVGYKNRDFAENVMLEWDFTNPQFSGQVTNEEIDGVTGDNVVLIYLYDPEDVLTDLSLTRMMPGSMSDETRWDQASISRAQSWYSRQRRTFGSVSGNLYGLIVPESPHPSQLANDGVTLELSTSGGSSKIQVAYARAESPVPTSPGSNRDNRRRQLAGSR